MLIFQKIAYLFLFLTFSLFSGILLAQKPANTDSLFRQAQRSAFSRHYQDSRQLCRQVLAVVPEHADAAVLMGRTYAWQEQFDSARMVLKPLVQQEMPPADAFVALAMVELWAGFPEKSLACSNKGLEAHPAFVPLWLSKAHALRDLQEYAAVRDLLEEILQKDSGNREVEIISNQLKELQSRNSIKAFYQVSVFKEDLNPWHLGTLEYHRSSTKGKYLLRLNYAKQFERQSFQAEVDAYPKLGRKTYAYLNAGVSDQNLFPSLRGGAEVFHAFPAKVEASLGARALFFTEESVVLYTGHISKYFSRYWMAFRPFLQEKNDKWELTGVLQLRRYLPQKDAFIELLFAKGSTPVVQVGIQEIVRLDASRFSLEGQFRVGDHYIAGGVVNFEFEELLHHNYRHRFTTGVSVQREF